MSLQHGLSLPSGFLAAVFLAVVVCGPCWAQTSAVRGEGSYLTVLPPGAKGPPETSYRTERVASPTPTNRWWSSLAWVPFSATRREIAA